MSWVLWELGSPCPRACAYTYECVACGKQTSAQPGLNASDAVLTVWFWVNIDYNAFNGMLSAQQLMGQLGLGSYKTAWLLVKKLRR